MKKCIKFAGSFGILAIVSGVFYREFTKLLGFTGKTTLAFAHLHLFAMGMLLFLLLALFCAVTTLGEQKQFARFLTLYPVSLLFMVAMLYVRGVFQVLGTDLSRGLTASISGMAGLAHILMTVALVFLFQGLCKCESVYHPAHLTGNER